MNPALAIAADDETTWPDALRDYLASSLDVLSAHEEKRNQIDHLYEVDPMLRYHGGPPNPHQDDHERVMAGIHVLIADACLVGYHCTRLHADEIDSITRGGLRPLSQGMAAERVRARVAAGDLDPRFGERLIAMSLAREKVRAGRVYLVFTRGLLGEERGVSPLFGFWGGEALYRAHATEPELAEPLRAIGTACIVEGVVSAKATKTCFSLGELLVAGYLCRRGHEIDGRAQWEGYVERPVEVVRRVITRNDPDFERLFERLTNCARWDETPS